MLTAIRGVLALTMFCILSLLAPESAEAQDKEQPVQVSPSNLFTGELKRLEPHLGLTTGCVKLTYDGPEVPVTWVVQVWRNGEWKDVGGSGTGQRLSGDAEVSISTREVMKDEKPMYKVVVATSELYTFKTPTVTGGSTSSSFFVDQPASTRGSSAKEELGRTLDVKVPGEVVVWAWKQQGNPGRFSSGGPEPVEKRATKSAEWALALKLEFGET